MAGAGPQIAASRIQLVSGATALVLAVAIIALSRALYGGPGAAPEPRLDLVPARFSDLPGWDDDDAAAALSAFVRSCSDVLTGDPARAMGGAGYAGTRADWRPVCAQAVALGSTASPDEARAFFTRGFRPVAVLNAGIADGLMTGYYEPEFSGTLTRVSDTQAPLWGRPGDLVNVDLGQFREEWRGERVAGRVEQGALVPYAPRAEIVASGLADRAAPVAFADDPVDAFFLEIQGSGRLRLPDGTILRLGYDGQNGHPYTAIGRRLIAEGEIPREQMSMQAIRAWLAANPARAQDMMNTNASYVFFRVLEVPEPDLGAFGAEGVQLTPGRSLAVDRRFHALGIPVFVATTLPAADETAPDSPFSRLMIAQDTGGAIRGPVRGDIYVGAGDEAAAIAGRTRHSGRFWVLLPAALADRVAP